MQEQSTGLRRGTEERDAAFITFCCNSDEYGYPTEFPPGGERLEEFAEPATRVGRAPRATQSCRSYGGNQSVNREIAGGAFEFMTF